MPIIPPPGTPDAVIRRRRHALQIATPLLTAAIGRGVTNGHDTIVTGLRAAGEATGRLATLVAAGGDEPASLRYMLVSDVATLLGQQFAVSGEMDFTKLIEGYQLPELLNAADDIVRGLGDAADAELDPMTVIRLASLRAMSPLVAEIAKFPFYSDREALTREVATKVHGSARGLAIQLSPINSSASSRLQMYQTSVTQCGRVFTEIYRSERLRTVEELLTRSKVNPEGHREFVTTIKAAGGMKDKLARIYSEYGKQVQALAHMATAASADISVNLDPDDPQMEPGTGQLQ
ncbi:hypothetical protein GE253_22855 [Niveispirillum sp. SYP-B3756]|uniref:hypothetical protein n=1 Tax=Niveispirillum sp. SYP-B3756 TaxID=2662178 RepID=UPI001291A75E|nr:hypothetical protein [Niveispirillum sp. SYP-B3756]MQP68162.1 hypothetical protein [Niveispirillum sp. SYP-B3756]